MNAAEDILAEYIILRKNGLEANDVLNTLRPYIEPLSKASKQELAGSIRGWEKQHIMPKPAPDHQPIKSIKSPSPPEKIKRIEEADWITCPHCGKKSRANAVFCYSCGLMLDIASTHIGTRHFTDRLTPNNEYFGADSVLVLKVPNTEHEYEVRPQTKGKELSVGRSAPNSAMTPDVDLQDAGAERHGVSRLHMAIKYDPGAEAIQIQDLGSINGTFINGQKLHPKEIRVLRNGDEITLGHLVIRADFHHPGDEIK